MKYKLYTTSQKAWDGMLSAISLAQKTIYIEMYIFLDNTQATHNFLKLLKEKSLSGLEVVIIADAYGSSSLQSVAVSKLRESGIEFIYFSHWFKRTHRKILIIDNNIAFIGGVNIEEKFRNWSDLQIKIQGKIVKPLLRSFAYTYKMIGGQKKTILKFATTPLAKKIKSWIIDNLASTAKIYFLNDYYKKKIDRSRKHIFIVTPYLSPPRWLIASLDDACRRGVKVEFLIPNDTDVKPLNKVNYLNACRLSEIGVKFYLGATMNHAKIMLIDNEEGVIGSQNMDILSFNWNIEVGVFFRQKDLVRDLQKITDKWKKEAVQFEVPGRKINILDRFLIIILKIFYPIF